MLLLSRTRTASSESKPDAIERGRTRRPAPTVPTRLILSGMLSLVIAFALQSPGPRATAAAQDTAATPERIDPTSCAIEPRAFDEIADLASTPVPAATPASGEGTAADGATVQDVTDTVVIAVACANANDPLRSYALFTDRYLAERFGAAHPDDLGSLYASLSREPTPAAEEDLLSLVEVRDVTTLADGWAAAIVVTENQATTYTDRLVFQQVEGRWLIDSWSPVEDNATPNA